MISLRYKSGYLHFKTVKELIDTTGWDKDIVFMNLKKKEGDIKGIKILVSEESIIANKVDRVETDNIQEYTNAKRNLQSLIRRRKRVLAVVKRYDDTWFPGRIETNEVKYARKELERLNTEIDKAERLKLNLAKYKSRRR